MLTTHRLYRLNFRKQMTVRQMSGSTATGSVVVDLRLSGVMFRCDGR